MKWMSKDKAILCFIIFATRKRSKDDDTRWIQASLTMLCMVKFYETNNFWEILFVHPISLFHMHCFVHLLTAVWISEAPLYLAHMHLSLIHMLSNVQNMLEDLITQDV